MLNTLRSLLMVWVLGSVLLIFLTEIPHQNSVHHLSVHDSYIAMRPLFPSHHLLFDSKLEHRRLRGTVDIQNDEIATHQPIKNIIDFDESFERNGFEICSVDPSIMRSYDKMLDKLSLSHALELEHVLSVLSDDELEILNQIVGDFANEHNLDVQQIYHSSSAMIESSDNSFMALVRRDTATKKLAKKYGMHGGNDGHYPLTLLIPINNLDHYIVGFVDRNIPSSLAGHYRLQQLIPKRSVLFLNEQKSMHYLSWPGSDRMDSKAIAITVGACRTSQRHDSNF